MFDPEIRKYAPEPGSWGWIAIESIQTQKWGGTITLNGLFVNTDDESKSKKFKITLNRCNHIEWHIDNRPEDEYEYLADVIDIVFGEKGYAKPFLLICDTFQLVVTYESVTIEAD